MDSIASKHCPVCGQDKPITEFAKDKQTKDGLQWRCKVCNRARTRAYYEANRAKVLARTGKYQREHPDKGVVFRRTYRLRHYEQVLERGRQAAAQWREQNREKDRANARQWAKSNPQKARLIHARRRARVRGSQGTFTLEEWQVLKQQYGYRCLRCERTEPDITLSIDHVIPLSRGGRNDISNIQPLCRECNASKGNRHSTDYRPQDRRKYYQQQPLF